MDGLSLSLNNIVIWTISASVTIWYSIRLADGDIYAARSRRRVQPIEMLLSLPFNIYIYIFIQSIIIIIRLLPTIDGIVFVFVVYAKFTWIQSLVTTARHTMRSNTSNENEKCSNKSNPFVVGCLICWRTHEPIHCNVVPGQWQVKYRLDVEFDGWKFRKVNVKRLNHSSRTRRAVAFHVPTI